MSWQETSQENSDLVKEVENWRKNFKAARSPAKN